MPDVSIGIPVYNGEEVIARAIESFLSQSYLDFELIISDNNSSDSTGLICRDYAKQDQRIIYRKQEKNFGLQKNLAFVLKSAKGEYFVWNAADDWRTPGFIEANVLFLKQNPNFIGSTSPNCFEDEVSDQKKWVTFSLDGGMDTRLQDFLTNCWRSHGIFYGLFRRREILNFDWPRKEIFAVDWLFDTHMLLRGPINRLTEELFISGRGGLSDSPGAVSRFRHNFFDYLFPLGRFTSLFAQQLVRSTELQPYQKIRLISQLVKLNWKFKLRSE